jgi:hypothetical protein
MLIAQVPVATDVTEYVAFGPFADVVETVAMPLHVSDSENAFVYPVSVTPSDCDTPIPVNVSAEEASTGNGVDVGLGVGSGVAGVGDGSLLQRANRATQTGWFGATVNP